MSKKLQDGSEVSTATLPPATHFNKQ